MRAVLVNEFGPFDSARVQDIPNPTAGPNEVILAVKAADVNYPDMMVMEGTYQVRPSLPFSPGKAAAGVIEEVGAEICALKPGDRVMACVEHGAYAEKIRAPAYQCHPMPDEISFEKAAAMGLVYLTAYFALRDRAVLKQNESVFVIGAKGGIGMASIQVAKALGAGVVIAGVRDSENAEFVEEMGADHVLDLSMEGLRDNLRKKVYSLTNGQGVDVVIDPVGGFASAAALRALAWKGRLVVIGFASGVIPEIKTNYLLVKNITVTGLQISDYRDREPDKFTRAQAELFEFYNQGLIDPHIGLSLPLDSYAEALDKIRTGRVKGKVVLKIGNN